MCGHIHAGYLSLWFIPISRAMLNSHPKYPFLLVRHVLRLHCICNVRLRSTVLVLPSSILPPTYHNWRFVSRIIFVIFPCHSLLLAERFLLHHHLEGLDRSLGLIYEHELTSRTPFKHANHVLCIRTILTC